MKVTKVIALLFFLSISSVAQQKITVEEIYKGFLQGDNKIITLHSTVSHIKKGV